MTQAIERILNDTGSEFRYFSSERQPPTEADIVDLETTLGRRLPDDYRAFLARWGLLILDVDEATWPRPAAYEVRPLWQMQFARFVHGLAARTSPDFLVRDAAARHAQLAPGFVPILRAPMTSRVEGYDAAGAWVAWDGEALVPTDHASFTDAVVAAFASLVADRERLRTEPIVPA